MIDENEVTEVTEVTEVIEDEQAQIQAELERQEQERLEQELITAFGTESTWGLPNLVQYQMAGFPTV